MLIQFLLFFSFFIDGFAFAGEALVGKYVGARQLVSLKKAVKRLFIWGVSLALVFTIIYLTGINFSLKLLTSQSDIIKKAQPFIPWVIAIPLASFGSFIWDGIFIGATASREMRNALLAAAFLVFAPVFFFLNQVWENHALWLGMVLFMLARGVFQTLMYKKAIIKPLL